MQEHICLPYNGHVTVRISSGLNVVSKKNIISKIIIALALVLPLLWPAQEALALSVEWKNMPGRERVIIRLDASDGNIGRVSRNAATSLVLPFSSGSKAFSMTAPVTAKIFSGVESAPGGLLVRLKTSEFGFIVTRPSPTVLHLDIYPDALGKRWGQSNNIAAPEAQAAPAGKTVLQEQPANKPPAVRDAQQGSPVTGASVPVDRQNAGATPSTPEITSGPASGTVPDSKTPEPAISQQPAAQEPSSVFSGRLEPVRQPDEPADVEAPALPEAAVSPPANNEIKNPLDSGDDYKLPEWPPMELPPSLPPPPPPVSPGASMWPAPAPHSVSYNGAGGALSVFEAGKVVPVSRRISWRDFLPFSSVAHAASAGAAEEYELIQAPFAHRGVLDKNREPGAPQESRPVMVRVPKGMFNADQDEPATGGAPQGLPPLQGEAQGGGQGSGTGAESGGQTSAAGAQPEVEPPVFEPPFQTYDGGQTGQQQGAGPAGQTGAPAGESAQQQEAGPAGQTGQSAGAEGTQPQTGQNAGPESGRQPPVQLESGQLPPPPINELQSGQDSGQNQPGGGQQAQNPQNMGAGQGAQAQQGEVSQLITAPVMPKTQDDIVPGAQYHDEFGNPVEPPLAPAPTLREAERKITDGIYGEAVQLLDKLLQQHNLTAAQRETALHRKADALFSLYEDDLVPHYSEIVDSTTLAINFNTRSPKNAAAYLRLGYTNLKAGNAYEAAGYFNVLRREYPRYENLALSYFYWGDYQYGQGNLNEAAEQFQYVINNYPDHPIVRDSAIGLSRSYYRMGYFDKSYEIMRFVEMRWPSFYMDYPPILSMMGDVAYRTGNLDKARASYWLYYNLSPNAEDADMILTRLGDIYMAEKYKSAATQVYMEALKRFPAKDGGIIARMRLAEEGVYDEPLVSDMFKVFERPYDQRPAEAYRAIIKDYPDSALVPLAKLKLAMWTLWQKDYVTVFDLCSDIVAKYPDSPLAPRAREVAMSAFTLMAAEDTNDKRYNRAREIWDRYPILQLQAESLDPESRLALAVSQWNTDSYSEALSTLEPFFYGSKFGEVSEMALFLALNIMTSHSQWAEIEELARRVELWELTPQAQNQMDYALALAYDAMEKVEAAVPLWERIYAAKILPPRQLANAAFYMARSAERNRDLESAYYIGQDALKRLLDVSQNDPESSDVEKIKTQLMSLIDITESSGILQQALDYAQQYLSYASEDSLDQQAVIHRMARIHKKRGDTADWIRILEDLASKYPNSVFGKSAKSELSAYRLGNDASRYSNMQF